MHRFKISAMAVYYFIISFVLLFGCKPKKFIYKSPPHYNFQKPYTDRLDLRIKEISGIVWDNHKDEFIAHNDEKGTIFYLDRDTKEIKREFAFRVEKGDYEDIAIVNNDVYVLISDGSLFRIVVDSAGKQKTFDVGKLELSGKKDLVYRRQMSFVCLHYRLRSGKESRHLSAHTHHYLRWQYLHSRLFLPGKQILF